MSSPVSFSDILEAIRICQQIREKWFDPINNAQVKYFDFKHDIIDLEKRLSEFKDAFSQALVHVGDPDPFFLGDDSIHDTLKQEADELVGDFTLTLKDSHNLLADHVKFDSKRGNVLDNAHWHSSTEAKVNRLRSRIQLHVFKIRLFLEPLQLRLTNHILMNTNEIIDLLRSHFGLVTDVELPGIPAHLIIHFQDALKRDAPIPITDLNQIPLKEGINALILHHRQSLISTETSRPVEQHLNLLKAHWLVEILSQSEALKQVRSSHLYRRIIKQVEQRIAKQYARTDISHYGNDALSTLEQSAFAIWPEKTVVPEQQLTEPMDQEEKLAELSLVHQHLNVKRRLFVFRVNERNLRIVDSRTPDNPTLGPKELVNYFDLNSDTLVPLYTITASPRAEWNIEIVYGNGAATVAYPLKERADAFKLQRAFTGYDIPFYFGGVSGTVTYKASGALSHFMRDGQHEGHGEIQLWQWPQCGRAMDSTISPRTSVGNGKSSTSDSSHSIASRAFQGINPSVISISQDENGEEAVLSSLPPPPLLMAFTEDKKRYRIWKTDSE
jgi:hypothetical protein